MQIKSSQKVKLAKKTAKLEKFVLIYRDIIL